MATQLVGIPAIVITGAVEGICDEVALSRICDACGTRLGDVYGRTGKQFILTRLNGYNNSARFRHWVILVDLDEDFACAPDAVQMWLENPAELMCLRLAVHELEAWILSDPERLASFLVVRRDQIPIHPDAIVDPKAALIDIARRSRSRAIREDMVPNQASGQTEGPAYSARLIEFLSDREAGWRPEIAAENSDSLRRCLAAVRALVSKPFPAR